MSDPIELLHVLGVQTVVPRINEALTHSSFVNEHAGVADYQRLEFLGDAVLGLCVTELLLEQVPSAREGQLTRMRASLVNTDALAEFARSIDLVRWVNFGRGAAASGDANRPKVLADVVEAIVGAIYVAQGLDGARAITQRITGEAIRLRTSISRRDPKSELQELTQRGGGEAPIYRVVRVEGPDHNQCFDVEVCVRGAVVGTGRGRSKKIAEQMAAQIALRALKQQQDDPP